MLSAYKMICQQLHQYCPMWYRNTVDILCITKIRPQTWKDTVKMAFVFIYMCNNSGVDNEEQQQNDCFVRSSAAATSHSHLTDH